VFQSLDDFAPEGTESGVGLALTDERGRYIFILAGSRHQCPPGQLFYAGIGGHREPGESWEQCARREAMEELSTEVELISSRDTLYIPVVGSPDYVNIDRQPRPLALYEMIHPQGTPHEGELYRIVIFNARLEKMPDQLQEEEVGGIIALKPWQVIVGVDCRPTLDELLEEGADLILDPLEIEHQTILYPIGTAVALSDVLRCSNVG
jgi:8-oxo-dGTP pyrophosphatase MutT (NUDIX family)